jgi:RES domain-containing protein
MRLSSCGKLTLSPHSGYWYRAIRQEHWHSRLSARHTKTLTGRFNAGSVTNPTFQVLYLSQDHQLALFDVRALLGNPESPFPDPRSTWTALNLKIVLQAVADLTSPVQQKLIGISDQLLTGKWDQYKRSGQAPTQLLGAALFDVPKLEGFLVPTAVSGISGTNLIVFPEKLARGSSIEFRNPVTGKAERLKI